MDAIEIKEDLDHEQKMLKIRRRNLRALEEQEANYGLNVPMEIRNQLAVIKEYIHDHEKRIDELQVIMSEGDEPISEVEYKMHLAEIWDVSDGYPRFAQLYRLDFIRLKLHITPERARELELEIRNSLALEIHTKAMRDFDYRYTLSKLAKWICGEGDMWVDIRSKFPELSSLWRILLLDPKVAIDHFIFQLEDFMDAHGEVINKRAYFLFKPHYFFEAKDEARTMHLLKEGFGADNPITREEVFKKIDELFQE